MIPILMISQGWFCPVFEASPGRLITILEIFGAACFVGQVACRKNRARNLLDQLGCRPGAFRILATGDIARSQKYKRLLRVLLCRPDFGALQMIAWRSRLRLRQGLCRNEQNYQDWTPSPPACQFFSYPNVSGHPAPPSNG